jgi:TetR/AcrR family transcriptional regulator
MQKKQGRGRDGKTRLLRAAKQLIRQQSFDDITIDAIVKAARLSRPAFYYHFAGGKEELRAELVSCGIVKEAPAQDTRAIILEAALRVFARAGISAATLDDIAAEAGVSRGTLCWHYHSKDDLLLAVMGQSSPSQALYHTLDQIEQDMQQGALLDDEAILRRIAGAFYDRFVRHSDLLRLLVLITHTHPDFTQALVQKIGKGRRRISEYIRRRQKEGAFRKDIDAELFVQIIAMAFFAHAVGQGFNELLPFAQLSREDAINQMVSTLLYGIINRDPPASTTAEEET